MNIKMRLHPLFACFLLFVWGGFYGHASDLTPKSPVHYNLQYCSTGIQAICCDIHYYFAINPPHERDHRRDTHDDIHVHTDGLIPYQKSCLVNLQTENIMGVLDVKDLFDKSQTIGGNTDLPFCGVRVPILPFLTHILECSGLCDTTQSACFTAYVKELLMEKWTQLDRVFSRNAHDYPFVFYKLMQDVIRDTLPIEEIPTQILQNIERDCIVCAVDVKTVDTERVKNTILSRFSDFIGAPATKETIYNCYIKSLATFKGIVEKHFALDMAHIGPMVAEGDLETFKRFHDLMVSVLANMIFDLPILCEVDAGIVSNPAVILLARLGLLAGNAYIMNTNGAVESSFEEVFSVLPQKYLKPTGDRHIYEAIQLAEVDAETTARFFAALDCAR